MGLVMSSNFDVLIVRRNIRCTPISDVTNVEKCALDLMTYGKHYSLTQNKKKHFIQYYHKILIYVLNFKILNICFKS